jgi:hypothetical protein
LVLKKRNHHHHLQQNITDKEDLEEITKIAEMLNPNEEVFVVAAISARVTEIGVS